MQVYTKNYMDMSHWQKISANKITKNLFDMYVIEFSHENVEFVSHYSLFSEMKII